MRMIRLLKIAVLFAFMQMPVGLLFSQNPIVAGKARFTVICPELIRMEYASNGIFVNEPTLFAFERSTLSSSFSVKTEGKKFIISTSRMELSYINDGLPFSQMNIRIKVHRTGKKDYDWRIYSENQQNLGGTLSTLDDVSAEVPVGEGLLSRDGWYVIDDSGKELIRDGWLAERPKEHLRDLYFFAYGSDYKAALKAFTSIGGKVPMTRKYVHGSWYCRWWNYTEQDYRDIIQGYKDHDFPIDILVMDMGWHKQNFNVGLGHAGNYGWTGYSWNKDLIPQPEKLISDLKKDHIYVTLNDHPADGIRYSEDYYAAFMKAMNADTTGGNNLLFDAGNREYMTQFFKYAHEPLEKQGVDFWWLDWQQDYVMPNVQGYRNVKHLPWLNHLYYAHSQQEQKRGLAFSRWAGWGSHRTPIQFSGDAHGNWDMLKFQVKFTAQSANVGCFFWAHDIGGFYGKRDAELYIRWTQFGLTNSSLRIHSVFSKDLDRRPWLWGNEAEVAMRKVYHLRSQLMPYIYSSVWQCHSQSIGLTRSMYIEYPDNDTAYVQPQQYLFGDALLAAPITSIGEGEQKVAQQKVWLPAGEQWYDFFSNKAMRCGEQVVSASIDQTLLYAKGGIPIPMQPYRDRMTSAVLDTLILKCFPGVDGKTGSYQLYEDDGISMDYTFKKYALTDITYKKEGKKVRVTISPAKGSYSGQPLHRAYQLQLPCMNAKAVTVNGKITKFVQENALLLLNIPKSSIQKSIIIEINQK